MTSNLATPADSTATRHDDGTMVVTMAGDWLLSGALPSPDALIEQLRSGVSRLAFDTTALAEWDTAALAFVLQLSGTARNASVPVDASGLPAGLQRLLVLAEAVPEKADAKTDAEEYGVVDWIGLTTLSAQASAGDTLEFLGQTVIAVGRFIRGKARYRRSDLTLLLQQAGIEALGIVVLVAFLLGLILAFVSAIQLQQFGAAIYVADLVGIAMVRDMGALITAIVMAGRSGAAYAAQLGTMKVNEEIDALATMGIDPIEFLVLPRFVALVLMMPLLTLFADAVGILGGMLVGVSMLDLSFTAYYQQSIGAISVTHLLGGMFKGAVYGILIAVAGSMRGMQSGRSAGAVGSAATSAVVTGVVWIIAAAGVFSFVFYLLGW